MTVYYVLSGVALVFMVALILAMLGDVRKARREHASLREAAANLGDKKRELVAVVRKELFRLLGVDRLVRKAFNEGWEMRGDTDASRIEVFDGMSAASIDDLIHRTRCWRSLDEAWANSDVEELV